MQSKCFKFSAPSDSALSIHVLIDYAFFLPCVFFHLQPARQLVQPLQLGYLIGCSLGIAPGINLWLRNWKNVLNRIKESISCFHPSMWSTVYVCTSKLFFLINWVKKNDNIIHTYDIILRENMLDDRTEINWLLSCIIMDLLWSILFGTVWNMDCMLDSLNHSVWTSDSAKEPTWNRVHKQVPSLSLL